MMSTIDPQLADFLYWHAVSKMRMAEFADAEVLFRFLHNACGERTDAAIGRLYCLARLGDLKQAQTLVTSLRRKQLVPIEVALLGRLHRRCEFETAKAMHESTEIGQRTEIKSTDPSSVRMPHTLGDDQMARLAAEQL